MPTSYTPPEYTDCALEISVCSIDGEQYQVSILENCNGTNTFAKTVSRSGQTLPTVNFTGVCMQCEGFGFTCDLSIDGTLLPNDQVRLAINGNNCDAGRSFNEVQIVELSLSGGCSPGPDGNPVAPGP